MTQDRPSIEGSRQKRDADQALAARVAAGDAAAQRDFVRRLLRRVRATARYLCRDDAEAEDLAQVALIELLRASKSYQGRARLERWADRVAVRTILKQIKKRSRRERFLLPCSDQAERSSEGRPSDIVRRVLRRRLAIHLDKLSAERRQALVMKLVLGHSVDEIAEATGVSVNTVKDRLRVGRKLLRSSALRDPSIRELLEGGYP